VSVLLQATPEKQSAVSSIGLLSTSDWLGMVASIGCAIHCAAMPFIIASLPTWGLSFLADEAFHKWMALICIMIAIAAFIPGWRKHRRMLPAAVGGIGLALISLAAFGLAGQCCPGCESINTESSEHGGIAEAGCNDSCCEQCDKAIAVEADRLVGNSVGIGQVPSTSLLVSIAPWLTPVGAIILVIAHLLNRRFGYLCGCCLNPSLGRV